MWHAALVPMAILFVRYRPASPRPRHVMRAWLSAPKAYRMVAVGFSVSWWADGIARLMGGSWDVVNFYPSIQLGLFAYAFGSVLVPAALFSLTLLPPFDRPDVLVTLVGSAAVLYLARGDALGPSMLAYAGVGSLLYLVLVWLMHIESERFMWFWPPYQAARLVAFGLFAGALYARRA